jgi:hypothetical protein
MEGLVDIISNIYMFIFSQNYNEDIKNPLTNSVRAFHEKLRAAHTHLLAYSLTECYK